MIFQSASTFKLHLFYIPYFRNVNAFFRYVGPSFSLTKKEIYQIIISIEIRSTVDNTLLLRVGGRERL